MFLGHYGAAFAVRPAAPRLPLGTCVLAAQWADLLWPALLLAGVERVRITPGTTVLNPLEFIHYPVSHSLLALVGWGVALGGLTWWRRRALADGVVIAALVVSHWVLDLFVHRPDLPVWPGSPPAGLGLWNSPLATYLLEAGTLLVGLVLYLRATVPRDRVGALALWGVVLVLAAAYLAGVLGPPPASVQGVAVTALVGGWALVAWAYWIDRHRRAAS